MVVDCLSRDRPHHLLLHHNAGNLQLKYHGHKGLAEVEFEMYFRQANTDTTAFFLVSCGSSGKREVLLIIPEELRETKNEVSWY